jgi:subtilisin family serine protease
VATGLVGLALGIATQEPAWATSAPGNQSSCSSATPAAAQTETPWAQLRLAPQQAWSHTRGKGITVAVIDSGVDATVPALAGRVAQGVDVVTGKNGADSDCLGHGTAMAAIVAAQPVGGTRFVGMAPGVMVMPIRVTVGGSTPLEQLGTAIDIAVSAGVAVIMIGQPINVADAALAAAISGAVDHDVVVVVSAQAAGADDQAAADPPTTDSAIPGVLRVGAIAADDKLVGSYPAGAVDVLAPGAGIVSLGANGSGEIQGSGSDFAVPFVVGVVALVRARFPELSAPDAVRQVEHTADHAGMAMPDARFAWGVVNPGAAVSANAVSAPSAGQPSHDSAFWPVRIALVVIVWAGATAGIVVPARRRRARRRQRDSMDEDEPRLGQHDQDVPTGRWDGRSGLARALQPLRRLGRAPSSDAHITER